MKHRNFVKRILGLAFNIRRLATGLKVVKEGDYVTTLDDRTYKIISGFPEPITDEEMMRQIKEEVNSEPVET